MKRVTKILLAVFLCCMMAAPSLSAQNQANSKQKMTKQERKEKRLKASLESRKHFFQLLQARLFVMEANELYGRTGVMIPVSPSLNFLAVKGNKVIFQFGLDGGMMGPNGVGGMTAEGFIDHYSFNPGKTTHKTMEVSGDIRPKGSGDWVQFYLTVGNNGNAYLNMTFPYGGRLSMNGYIRGFNKSSVFKGQTWF